MNKALRARTAPTEYSEADLFEFFAEHYALYRTGKRDMMIPDMIPIVESVMKERL